MRHYGRYLRHRLRQVQRIVLLVRDLVPAQICLGIIIAVALVNWMENYGLFLLSVSVVLLKLKFRWLLLSVIICIVWLSYIYFPGAKQVEESLVGKRLTGEAIIVEVMQRSSYEQQAILKTELVGGLSLGKLPAYPEIAAGDHVYGMFFIDKLAENLEYLRSEGINLILSSDHVELLENQNVESRVHQFKAELINRIQVNLPEEQGALLVGLLAGGRAASLSKELKSDLKLSGLSHIASISGYNVSIIVGALIALAGLIPRRWLVIGLIPLLIIFLLFIGVYNLPAARAVVMGSLVLFGVYVGRPVHWSWALIFALSLLLLFNPLAINSVSLWLSLLAFIGVCSFTHVWSFGIPSFTTLVRETLAATFSVSVVSMPLMIQMFGSVSLVGLISNLFALPLIPPIMALGTLAAGIDILHDQIGNACFWLVDGMLRVVIFIADTGAKLEFLQIDDMRIAWGCWAGLIIIMLIIDYRKYINARVV
jgi:ComEC/Rec2-related protein